MGLVERDHVLSQLHGFYENARAGAGRIVCLGGEAGSGKTSVAEAFVTSLPDDGRMLWGACDPLSTPRPRAPLHEMPPLATARGRSGRYERASGLLDEFAASAAVVIKDARRAGEETLAAYGEHISPGLKGTQFKGVTA